MAIVRWIGRTFSIFAAFTVEQENPALDKGINGGALRVAGGAHRTALQAGAQILALSMWQCGGRLHTWMMSLIV